MAKTKRTFTQSAPKSTQETAKPKVKVLYQNLGGTWYAFADVNDSIFVGKVNVSAKENTKAQSTKRKKTPEKEAA